MFRSKNLSNKVFRFVASLLFAVVALGASNSVQAGEITGYTWSSGVASVADEPITMPTPDLNNDNVAGTSPNLVRIPQKHYTGIGPVDIEFTVRDSGGVTEYVFEEGLDNSTGIDWTDYHMQLGFGMGDDFVPSEPGDGLGFDAPDFDSPVSFAPFSTVTVTEDDIDAVDGLIPSPSFTFPIVFNIDVPDGITAFTVRQYPTIPEPGSLTLALIGLCGLLRRRRRKVTYQFN